MTDNFAQSRVRRSVDLEAGQVPEAVLRRLVLAADADRRAIERALHEGVHQHLVALAVSLQLARQAVDSDTEAVTSLLEEMSRDVQQALDETAFLAQRIYPATFETAGLGALLRTAAVNAGVPASVDAAGGAEYSPEVGMTVYLCWLAMLARGSGEGRVTIDLREGEKALAFEIKGQASDSDADLDPLGDRVEALGGRLTIEPAPDGAIRVSASLPLSR
jgi:signal transduction histidine kinase